MKQGNELIRLKDSLEKLTMAQKNLEEAIALPIKENRDIAGIIQSFIIVYELSWKTLKRLLEVLGHETGSARDVFKMAYKVGLLTEEQLWLEIIDARNAASHTYNKLAAEALARKIIDKYTAAFKGLVGKVAEGAGGF